WRRARAALRGLIVAPTVGMGGATHAATSAVGPWRRTPVEKEGGRDGGRTSRTGRAHGTQRALDLAVDHRLAGAGAADLGDRRDGRYGRDADRGGRGSGAGPAGSAGRRPGAGGGRRLDPGHPLEPDGPRGAAVQRRGPRGRDGLEPRRLGRAARPADV